MKKMMMVLAVAVFAATSLSAKMSAAEKECRKGANDTLKAAQVVHKSSLGECKAKKGKDKVVCRKEANDILKNAKKTRNETIKNCKNAPAPAA
ncbi:MAG TPA: hypothetical protein PLY93_04670 [Turneriella sp.]|nr:hypothetical protein [Turneriella sp.]